MKEFSAGLEILREIIIVWWSILPGSSGSASQLLLAK
jgi:hypothetical protein